MRRWPLLLGLTVGCPEPYEPCETRSAYRDFDGDGFGDPSQSQVLCDALPGWVDAGSDCDDLDGAVHPGAEEVCNGVDDDCDTLVDGGLAFDQYLDADGDGFGIDETLTTTCWTAIGWVTAGGDCDDLAPERNPDADELCDNGLDDDCNGVIDDCY